MNYLAIGLFIILLIVIYNVYYYFTNTTLTSGLHNLNTSLKISYDKLQKPNSFTYSYQAWIYISSPTANTVSLFNRKGDSADSKRDFSVDLNGQILSLNAGQGSAEPIKIMTITNNFPIQKWTYLVINVYNLQTFEAYINGKLEKTVNVSSPNSVKPSSYTADLYIGNGNLSGYVTKFVRLPNTLDAKKIWDIYLNGNGLSNMFSSFMSYGLNMSVYKGEELQRVVQVF